MKWVKRLNSLFYYQQLHIWQLILILARSFHLYKIRSRLFWPSMKWAERMWRSSKNLIIWPVVKLRHYTLYSLQTTEKRTGLQWLDLSMDILKLLINAVVSIHRSESQSSSILKRINSHLRLNCKCNGYENSVIYTLYKIWQHWKVAANIFFKSP